MKVWVVLPAYNEAENLPGVLDGFKKMAEDVYNLQLSFILVDDGSTDDTAQIAMQCVEPLPMVVYRNERNIGLSETFVRGMVIASEQAAPDEIILCMDADNSHSPGLTLRMVRSILEGRDIVIASRYQIGAVVRGVPFSRRVLSRGMSWLFRAVYPIEQVRDYSCGYRAYRAGFLQKALESQGKRLFAGEGFACMAGLLISLARQGAVCGEVPIILRYDKKASGSKMNVARTIFQTLRMLMQERFRRG